MGWLFNWLSKLSPRERRLVYLAAVLVSLFLLDSFVVRNVSQRIDAINNQIDQVIKNVKTDQTYLDKKNKQLIDEEYKKYTSYLSTEQPKSATDLQKFVEEIAVKNSITIDKIAPSTTRESSKKNTIQVDCVGDRTNMITFLYQLSTSAIFLKIDKITFSPKKEDFVAKITLSQVSLQVE